MDRETIYQLGLSSGCIDPDLSGPDNWVTDYGGCEGCLTKFAQLVAAHEREQIAKLAESIPDAEDDACCVAMAFDIAFNIRART